MSIIQNADITLNKNSLVSQRNQAVKLKVNRKKTE